MTFHAPEKYRVKTGRLGTTSANGNNGYFLVPIRPGRPPLRIIASDVGLPGETAWEHVSVSLPDRCPVWAEMCFIKALFWDPEDAVIQFHPPEADYVNLHQFCLHLWRPVGIELPRPHPMLVGPTT